MDAYAAERGLFFSPNKTVSMIFKKRNKEPIEIKLKNKIILSKEKIWVMGMSLDSRLNWEEHIKNNTSYIHTLNTLDDRPTLRRE